MEQKKKKPVQKGDSLLMTRENRNFVAQRANLNQEEGKTFRGSFQRDTRREKLNTSQVIKEAATENKSVQASPKP